MPEEGNEATPTTTEDASTTATSEEPTGAPAPESTEDSTPAVDWEKRYNDQRSEFDRRGSLLAAAEGRQGPEAQAEALRQLGVEVEMEEPTEEEDTYVDPDERIDRLEQQLAERAQAEEQEQFHQLETEYIDKTLKGIEQENGVNLSDREVKIITNNALANRLEDGRPDLQGAFDDLKEIKSAARDEYLASKKTAKAPVGTAGEETIDLSDPEAKRKWMAEDLAARMAAQEGS